MATQGELLTRTMKANASLKTKPYVILRQTAAGICDQASEANLNAKAVIGVAQNKPDSGQAVTVAYFGESKVTAGGTCTAGSFITTDSSGRAVDATSGDFVLGMALQAAATTGEIIRCLLRLPAVQLTTSLNA